MSDFFNGSSDEIEAFKVWIYYDADDDTIWNAMVGVQSAWAMSDRRDRARERFFREHQS